MKNTLMSVFTVWVLVIAGFVGLFVFDFEENVSVSAITIYVDDDYTVENQTKKKTIQTAVDAANLGDTVYVYSGTYYENVIVNKIISLEGEERDNTIINGKYTGDTVYVSSDWVNITGFTVTGSGNAVDDAGIKLVGVDNCSISNNNVSLNLGDGIFLINSDNNIVVNNILTGNGRNNIFLDNSHNNTIDGNNISGMKTDINRNGLVGYWSMNEGTGPMAYDSSGNGNHGILKPDPQADRVNWTDGKFGKALEFDGVDDWVTLPIIDLTSTDFTILMWVKAQDLSENVIDRQYLFTSQENPPSSGLTYQGAAAICIGGNELFAQYPDNNGMVSSVTLVNDTWYYIASICEIGQPAKLYVNMQYTEGSTVDSVLHSHTETKIGRRGDAQGDDWCRSIIDEVVVYNRTLSAYEIALRYQLSFSRHGINLESSTDNTLSNNHLSTNQEEGINLLNSNNNDITRNTLSANGRYNINLKTSYDNTIQENTISGSNSIDQTGLVGYWKMEEPSWTGASGEVIDSSGNSNHGTAYDEANTILEGRYGRSGDFDGTDDYIDCGDSDSMNILNEITVEAWVKFDLDAGTRTIASRGGDADGWRLYSHGWSGDKFAFIVLEEGGGWGDALVLSSSRFLRNVWHHVIGTYNGSSVRIYVNGTLEGEITGLLGTGIEYGSFKTMQIAHSKGASVSFKGAIDEVRIYNRALSQREVADRYLFSLYGIYIEDSDNNRLINNNIASNSHGGIDITGWSNEIHSNDVSLNIWGIRLHGGGNNNVSFNNVSSNFDTGIYLSTSTGNDLWKNNVNSNPHWGIRLVSSNSNTLIDNTASSNEYGIYLSYSNNNNLLSNPISLQEWGIYLYCSEFNYLTYNIVSSIDNGITLDGATNNSLEYNNMIWNNYGVDIMNDASYNTITENNISSNIVCGVIMKSGTENNISRNIISNNFIGLRLRNIPRNYFTYNLISNNSNIGIQVIGDTHDLEIHHNDII
ncbi:MAG: right-handed parallel beta-helix repeat-containing protein, partial [Thermoplasmata archaeon]